MKRLIVLTVLFLTTSIFAAVPSGISYQGYLTDDTGTPIDGTTNIIFQLYSVESGGSAFWSEMHLGTAVTNGVFSVILGEQTPLNLDFSTDYWVGITVGGDSEMAPRVKFVAVPTALRAAEAEDVLDDTITTDKVQDGTLIDADINASANISPSKIAGTAWTAGNDGPGSGLHADQVDNFYMDSISVLNSGDILDIGRIRVSFEGVSGGNNRIQIIPKNSAFLQVTMKRDGAVVYTGFSSATQTLDFLDYMSYRSYDILIFYYFNSSTQEAVWIRGYKWANSTYAIVVYRPL